MSSSGSMAAAAAMPPRLQMPPRPGGCPASAASASPIRRGTASAPPTPTRGSAMTPSEPISHQRHAERKVAGATGEFLKPEARIGRQQRQPHLGQQFILFERRGHDALEMVARRDGARLRVCCCATISPSSVAADMHHSEAGSACASCRRRCRGCGSDDGRCGARPWTGAARADPRKPARRTPHAARRRRSRVAVGHGDARQSGNAIDIDEVRGFASRNAMIGTRLCPPASTRPSSWRDLRQRRDRFVDRLWRVITKSGGFHGSWSSRARALPPPVLYKRGPCRVTFHIWDYYYFLD